MWALAFSTEKPNLTPSKKILIGQQFLSVFFAVLIINSKNNLKEMQNA